MKEVKKQVNEKLKQINRIRLVCTLKIKKNFYIKNYNYILSKLDFKLDFKLFFIKILYFSLNLIFQKNIFY
ncbi:Uncharacterised protein [Chlamydia trachomatis]|nr:Uncharacterised protein [Chlamydia trachomatis]